MQTITTIGLDIAKSVFQVHGVDAEGHVIVRRQLKRRYMLAFFQKLPPCLIGIEACASSHHWSRELQAFGDTVRLMPPAYVKPYVKRHKNDSTDAEAICEAVTRPNKRFVATKTPEQQSCLTLRRTRHLFIRQQTSVINAIRAHLAEFGIVAPIGRNGVEQLLGVVAAGSDKRLPEVARASVAALGTQLRVLKAQILQFDRRITAWHRSNEASKRLDDIPGVGPVLATALVASVADPKAFRSGRDFSAWIGLVPKQNSSAGKDRLGSTEVLLTAPATDYPFQEITISMLRRSLFAATLVDKKLEPLELGRAERDNMPGKINLLAQTRQLDLLVASKPVYVKTYQQMVSRGLWDRIWTDTWSVAIGLVRLLVQISHFLSIADEQAGRTGVALGSLQPMGEKVCSQQRELACLFSIADGNLFIDDVFDLRLEVLPAFWPSFGISRLARLKAMFNGGLIATNLIVGRRVL
jgi:transposase